MSTLGELKAGERGHVIAFNAGSTAYRRKLLALGLTPGTEFTIRRVAPMGDPMQLQVRGFLLSVRKDEAAAIEVAKL